MFIAALFTQTKIWKQPKCLYIYIYIYTHTYIYNGILFSIRKKEILPFATTQIDPEVIMISKISQT